MDEISFETLALAKSYLIGHSADIAQEAAEQAVEAMVKASIEEAEQIINDYTGGGN